MIFNLFYIFIMIINYLFNSLKLFFLSSFIHKYNELYFDFIIFEVNSYFMFEVFYYLVHIVKLLLMENMPILIILIHLIFITII